MTNVGESNEVSDPHDLNRFLQAQEKDYEKALAEIKNGRKSSHWMWYIFPQIEGIGFSLTSRQYSLKSLAEAKAYLQHPVLGLRLKDCIEVLLYIEGRSAYDIFGSPDNKKLKSCATLFAIISPDDSVFEQLINKYFHGMQDENTLKLLGDNDK